MYILKTDKGNYACETNYNINNYNVLYYDSGLVSDMTPRCGTMDGNLKKGVKENEIPQKSGEANFDADGYQKATSITKELNIDGEWVIFKKYENQPENLEDYKYCFYIKGHLNNAAIDSETSEQISNIYVNDAYDNWAEVGGSDALLYPYCRNNDSGSHAQMEKHFLNGNEIHSEVQKETSTTMAKERYPCRRFGKKNGRIYAHRSRAVLC